MISKVFQEPKDFSDILPADWVNHHLWVRAYRMLHVTPEIFDKGTITRDFFNVKIVLFYGKIKYHISDPPKVESSKPGEIVKKLASIKPVETSEGGYILFIHKFEDNEPEIKKKIDEIVGLFIAINGLSNVYEYLFDEIINVKENTTTGFSYIVPNPFWFKIPDLSDGRLKLIRSSYEKISQADNILLSLRWFNEGNRKIAFDAFIPLWIALETLVRAQGKKVVNKINENLACCYGISNEEAANRFRIGYIYGLRKKIFHNGEILPIHTDLINYMIGIYLDILFYFLGIKIEKRAELILQQSEYLKRFLKL
ncbi:MAG: HEPN domain-containing protein [Candidatus Pacearchaeota archaeon]